MRTDLHPAWRAYASGEFSEAVRLLQALQNQDRNDVEVIVRLAQTYFAAGRTREAQGWFQEVSRLDQGGRWTAVALEGINECMLASPNHRPEHVPARVVFFRMAAENYWKNGSGQEAHRCWCRLLSLKPDDEAALHWLRQHPELAQHAPFGWQPECQK